MQQNYEMVQIPTLEHAINLVKSIPTDNEIDLRDRALIAFITCTGMDDSSTASLSMGCVDIDMLMVNRNSKAQLKAAYSKQIDLWLWAKIFCFDYFLIRCIRDWYRHLKLKGFDEHAPFFPRKKFNKTNKKAMEVEPEFWHNGSCVRSVFKERAKKQKWNTIHRIHTAI